ncbi:iron chaperone [Actinoplanes sp. CA-131856]
MTNTSATSFTAAERDAIKDRAKELKRSAKGDTEPDVLSKIADMADADREQAGQLHAVIKANAPELTPKLWYGMPAYYRNGKMICFFQSRAKFKTRYATLGFSDHAALDDGEMWPVYFALLEVDEQKIVALLRRALSA